MQISTSNSLPQTRLIVELFDDNCPVAVAQSKAPITDVSTGNELANEIVVINEMSGTHYQSVEYEAGSHERRRDRNPDRRGG